MPFNLKGMVMDQVHTDRLCERLRLCKKSIAKAKFDLLFWSKELAACAEELSHNKQFNFDEILKEI